MSTIGDRIKARREALGMTQEELADLLGYRGKSSVSKLESGQGDPGQSKVLAFARALKTTPAYLMGWVEDPMPTGIPPGFEPLPKMVKRPLVGSIACGEPITAEENIEDYVDVPEDTHCDFCLRCKGDSMIDAGIHDGDLVYIHIQPEVENGQIAAVRIDGEATLKRVFWDSANQVLQLVPANSSYMPKVYSGQALENVHVEGRAVGFTHWF
ncbi:LexA family transcriptional regulator [uncultured Subdoligranulum sp.]|uniref:LexA family protein n=1 Tax=uncultured Subdoligranulum sp. TaxID=512298 RepID=UPI00260A3E88|nr:LexA family transcriptional regulator [uncultured Subdoligranulum sp.]